MNKQLPQLKIIKDQNNPNIVELKQARLVSPKVSPKGFAISEDIHIQVRNVGDFKHTALFLPPGFEYQLGIDDMGSTILVILRSF